MQRFITVLCLALSISGLFSQNHFLVELENRSPTVSEMVQAYEGASSIPFLANDINGVEQSLLSETGKTVLLWFWNTACPKCLDQIVALNALVKKYPKDLAVISFANESKAELQAFIATTPVDFPIIPSSKTLSEGPYGGELGYPKFFMLDNNAKTKWVIPEVEMRGDFDTFNFFETLHVSLQKS